jgi:hypothetical protein
VVAQTLDRLAEVLNVLAGRYFGNWRGRLRDANRVVNSLTEIDRTTNFPTVARTIDRVTGTTLRVAQSLGRRYLGIEQQSQYVELIQERLRQSYQRVFFP